MTNYEKELYEALRFARQTKMPALLQDNKSSKLWSRAIVVVVKRNGSNGLAIAVNRGDGTPKLIKTFSPDGISSILEIHPYEYVDKPQLQGVRTKSKPRLSALDTIESENNDSYE